MKALQLLHNIVEAVEGCGYNEVLGKYYDSPEEQLTAKFGKHQIIAGKNLYARLDKLDDTPFVYMYLDNMTDFMNENLKGIPDAILETESGIIAIFLIDDESLTYDELTSQKTYTNDAVAKSLSENESESENRQDVINYLAGTGDYKREYLEKATERELFKMWCEWEGLYRYDQYILDVINKLWNTNLE